MTKAEVILLIIVLVVLAANIVILGLVPLNYACLGAVILIGGRGVLRWFNRRASRLK